MRCLRPLLCALLALVWSGALAGGQAAWAAPGLCTGPVCADLNDQLGHREKVVMDCRALVLSPRAGQVDRGYATALGRRACRLAGELS
jgi:hypothetical protein